MSYKLLVEIIQFEENKNNYSNEECIKIEKELRARTKIAMKSVGISVVNLFDKINDE